MARLVTTILSFNSRIRKGCDDPKGDEVSFGLFQITHPRKDVMTGLVRKGAPIQFQGTHPIKDAMITIRSIIVEALFQITHPCKDAIGDRLNMYPETQFQNMHPHKDAIPAVRRSRR